MNDNNGITRIREFAPGPGTIYVKRGRCPESMLEDYRFKLGDTDGGCRLTYEYKTRTLYDVEGNAAASLRYGEIMRIKGRLCRILADALPCLTAEDTLTVLLVCPLPEGDSFRVCFSGTVTYAGFDASADGGADFEITCGKGAERPTFKISGVDTP